MLLLHPKLIPLPEKYRCSDILWGLSSTQNYPKSPVQESKGRSRSEWDYSSSAVDEIKPPCAAISSRK